MEAIRRCGMSSKPYYGIAGLRLRPAHGRDLHAAKRLAVFYRPRHRDMLRYALIFLVIALIAAVLGFGGIAGTSAWIAKVIFVVFLVIFVISLITGRS